MKTPQISHGVLDIKTGKEITTPLGLPRNAPMKIELKNIKLAQFASQETNCYQASIYVDGKKSGTVRNDGQGGADEIDWDSKEIELRVDSWAKEQPPIYSDILFALTPEDPYLKFSLEVFFAELVDIWLATKDLKRTLKKGLIIRQPDDPKGEYNIFSDSLAKNKPQEYFDGLKRIKRISQESICFNLLPFDEALTTWRTI